MLLHTSYVEMALTVYTSIDDDDDNDDDDADDVNVGNGDIIFTNAIVFVTLHISVFVVRVVNGFSPWHKVVLITKMTTIFSREYLNMFAQLLCVVMELYCNCGSATLRC